MKRGRHHYVSPVQAEYTKIMSETLYATEYDRLKALAESYKAGRLSSAAYLNGLFWMFADDVSVDWHNDVDSLMRLTNAILRED